MEVKTSNIINKEDKNFHLPSWFSFSQMINEKKIEDKSKIKVHEINTKNTLINTNSTYSQVILNQEHLPEDLANELSELFRLFSDENNSINIHNLKNHLKSQNFHKENKRIYYIIEELSLIYERKEKELIDYREFIEFLEIRLLDFKNKTNLKEYFKSIIKECKGSNSKDSNNNSKEDNFKSYYNREEQEECLNSKDLLNIFKQENVNIEMSMLKKIMKEVFNVNKEDNEDGKTPNIDLKNYIADVNIRNYNDWDFVVNNEDFYNLMNKTPEDLRAYYSINKK